MKKNKLTQVRRHKKSARKTATNTAKQKRRVAKKNKELRNKAKVTTMVMEQMGSTKIARVQKLAEKQPEQPWKDSHITSVVMCSDNDCGHDHINDHTHTQDISEQDSNQNFLDEIIAERTEKNPEFPSMMAAREAPRGVSNT